MKIILNDNTELEAIAVNGSKRNVQGTERDTLEFVFAKDKYSLNELDGMFSDQTKTCKITLMSIETDSQTPTEFIHTDYSIKVSLSTQAVAITPETPEAKAKTEERICVTMAQLTYIEKQLSKLGVL